MYVRSTKVKGRLYYQLAEGGRDESGRVRTRYIISLGRHPRPEGALAEDLASLAVLEQEQHRTPSQDRRAAKLAGRVKLLEMVISKGLVSAASKRPGGGQEWARRLFRFINDEMPEASKRLRKAQFDAMNQALPKAIEMGFDLPGYLRGIPVQEWAGANETLEPKSGKVGGPAPG